MIIDRTRFARASSVVFRATADESATRPLRKMLRKWGFWGPIYVSAKRSQFTSMKKQGLSNYTAIGSDEKWCSNNLGSFSKTKPILCPIAVVFLSICDVLSGFWNCLRLKMLRTYLPWGYEMGGFADETTRQIQWDRAAEHRTENFKVLMLGARLCGLKAAGGNAVGNCGDDARAENISPLLVLGRAYSELVRRGITSRWQDPDYIKFSECRCSRFWRRNCSRAFICCKCRRWNCVRSCRKNCNRTRSLKRFPRTSRPSRLSRPRAKWSTRRRRTVKRASRPRNGQSSRRSSRFSRRWTRNGASIFPRPTRCARGDRRKSSASIFLIRSCSKKHSSSISCSNSISRTYPRTGARSPS